MRVVTSGAIAAVFMGLLMGAALKPSASLAAHPQAPRIVVEATNDGLLASAALVEHGARDGRPAHF